MSKWPRIVIPGFPHHVTHRGTRRQTVFFGAEDYKLYLKILGEHCAENGVEIWAYCLMPNHVHIVAVPETEVSLSAAFGRAHQQYSRLINARYDWRGHLWEHRYNSITMDEAHLLMAARYVELNPVRARLVESAEHYLWSSAQAHLKGEDDALVNVSRMLEIVPGWAEFLAEGLSQANVAAFRTWEKSGYPIGSDDFLRRIEDQFGIQCRPKKRGPKQRR